MLGEQEVQISLLFKDHLLQCYLMVMLLIGQ